jgi:sialidase-1
MAKKSAKRRTSEVNTYLSRATEQRPRQTEASLLAFPDGRLLAAYSDFYGGVNLDEAPAQIVGRWSKDEGETWSEPQVLQENIGRLNCMSASMLQLPSGRILLAFGRKDAEPTLLHAMVKFSDDEGKTWSAPQDITRGDRYWCITNDRLVRLSSGRILYPLESGPESECSVWYSDDDGGSWQMSTGNITAAKPLSYAEPTVVELKSGRVAMYIRTTSGNIHIALSEDGGVNWRMHKSAPPDMAGRPDAGPNAAYSPCMVKRIPSTGDLLLVWNNNRVRTPLTAAVSSDEGETWRHFRNLEEMDGWPPKLTHTYPSITFFKDNVHVTYWEAHKLSPTKFLMHLKYRRLAVGWFYERP